jgi:hypothetical protein
MSFVVAKPQAIAGAATNFASIGSAVEHANATAAAPTTADLAAGADQVSAAVGAVLSGHGQAYAEIGAQMAQFHAQFVQTLNASGGAFEAAEALNASPLRTGVQDLLGH